MITRMPSGTTAATLIFACLSFGTPVLAQAEQTLPGSNAEIAGTEIGQRQSRGDGATNIEPVRRQSNRIQNRVQNRIRNRIDRNYDPQANATSPFEVAAEKTSAARRRPDLR